MWGGDQTSLLAALMALDARSPIVRAPSEVISVSFLLLSLTVSFQALSDTSSLPSPSDWTTLGEVLEVLCVFAVSFFISSCLGHL